MFYTLKKGGLMSTKGEYISPYKEAGVSRKSLFAKRKKPKNDIAGVSVSYYGLQRKGKRHTEWRPK
jgi:hypothetical protein